MILSGMTLHLMEKLGEHLWGRGSLYGRGDSSNPLPCPHLSAQQKNPYLSRSSSRPASSWHSVTASAHATPHPLLDSFDNGISQHYWAYYVLDTVLKHFIFLQVHSVNPHNTFWCRYFLVITIYSIIFLVQAYLGDTVGSIPDHHSKANRHFLVSQCI